MRYVFVAGPYSLGGIAHNVRQALGLADRLLALGYIPILPHLGHFWDLLAPKPYEEWMKLSLAQVELADVLVRLPGLSPGADREEARARDLGIPVYTAKDFLAKAESSQLVSSSRGALRAEERGKRARPAPDGELPFADRPQGP